MEIHLAEPDMTYSPRIPDHGDADFVHGPGIVRPVLKFGIARMREAPVPVIGCPTPDPKSSGACFWRVSTDAALAPGQVAT